MILWVSGAAMALLAALIVLLPLWRRGGVQVGHTEGALAIFVDQLKEVEQERLRGLISDDEAQAASVEIKRRMSAWPKGKLVEVENAQHEVLMETPVIRSAAMTEIASFVAQTTETAAA